MTIDEAQRQMRPCKWCGTTPIVTLQFVSDEGIHGYRADCQKVNCHRLWDGDLRSMVSYWNRNYTNWTGI